MNKIRAIWKERASSQVTSFDIPQQGNSSEAQLSAPPFLDFQNCELDKTFLCKCPIPRFYVMAKENRGSHRKVHPYFLGGFIADWNSAVRDLTDGWSGTFMVAASPVSMLSSTLSVKSHLQNSFLVSLTPLRS